MDLPVMPPVLPMLAKPVPWDKALAMAPHLQFEAKWDGFRCLVFRDGDEIELWSRSQKELTRYFPELLPHLLARLPKRCVVDGELFVAVGGRLEFELLQARIHPAEKHITRVAAESPASYVVFDLLALDQVDCMALPFRERRAALASVLADLDPVGRIHLARTTEDPHLAERWFREFEGAGLDGVVGKPLDAPYSPHQRTMIKIKHARTADVVVAGMREHKSSTPERPLLGSLLLGLYDSTEPGAADGRVLQHVGVCATFTDKRREELWAELQELVVPIEGHVWGFMGGAAIANPDRVPGTQSRWSGGKDLSFVPLAPSRVVEVGYDHMEGRRFRHTTQFKRWRPDREPESCGYEQLETVASVDLSSVFEA